MEKIFKQINDFSDVQAVKLENSSYLEELTGLLAKVASRIDDDSTYCFGDEFYLCDHKDEPNSNFTHFVADFKNSINYGSSNKINIIRGRAGIGKSLFFEKGVQILIKNKENSNEKYIHMGVDFKNIDNNKDIEFYENWIYRKIHQNAIDCVFNLGDKCYEEFDIINTKYWLKYTTPYAYLFPLKFFCKKIFEKYRKPCIIVFDNIDLASVMTQKAVFKAVVNICGEFNKFMGLDNVNNCYRVYFAMRPETELRYNEGRMGEAINFPLPNILKISLSIIHKVLFDTAKEFDDKGELSCAITCQDVTDNDGGNITLETYTDVAIYLDRILNHYLGKIWDDNSRTVDRLGKCEEFHCNIVNYNVRTFVKFLSDTISNGGFKPLTKEFNKKLGKKYYTVYDYIEMIIRGRWPMHPGNKHINGEGGNKAPIVFNIFDTSLYRNNTEQKVKHFMLYIRILQYFFVGATNFKVKYGDMRRDLSNFYDEENIYVATRQLIYVRFLYSYIQGDNIIATISDCNQVVIDDTTTLNLSPIGKFYLDKMICEFEYLYQMALGSLMCEEYAEKLATCWKIEKERTVLYFLESIFEIIKENIAMYGLDELIVFKKMYYNIDNKVASKPFRRMLNGFISVMNNKVQRAERLDTNSASKLEEILGEAMELKKDVQKYFIETLG